MASLSFISALLLLLLAAVATFAQISTARSLADAEEQKTVAIENAKRADMNAQDAMRAKHAVILENQRAKLAKAVFAVESGRTALGRELLSSLDAVPELREHWRWAAWNLLRNTREIARVDLKPLFPSGVSTQSFMNGAAGAYFDIASNRVYFKAHKRPSFYIDLSTRQTVLTPDKQFTPTPDKKSRTLSDGRRIRFEMLRESHMIHFWNLDILTSDGRVMWSVNRNAMCYDLSPDEDKIAVGLNDGSVIFAALDSTGVREVARIQGYPEVVLSIRFSETGDKLHGVIGDWSYVTWDTRPSPDVNVTESVQESIVDLAIQKQGNLLASASGDGSVSLWDCSSEAMTEYRVAADADLNADYRTCSIDFLSQDAVMVTGYLHPAKPLLYQFSGREPLIESLPEAPQASRFSIASKEEKAVLANGTRFSIVNLRDFSVEKSFGRASNKVYVSDLRWQAGDGLLFVTYYTTGGLVNDSSVMGWEVWNTKQGKSFRRVMTAHSSGVMALDVSHDGLLLASGARGGEVGIWDWRNEQLIRKIRVAEGMTDGNIVTAVRFLKSESLAVLACCTAGGHVYLYSINDGFKLARIVLPDTRTLFFRKLMYHQADSKLVVNGLDRLFWIDLKHYLPATQEFELATTHAHDHASDQ